MTLGEMHTGLVDQQPQVRSPQLQTIQPTSKCAVTEAAYQQAVASRRRALALLSDPFQSHFVTLGEPSLVWDIPYRPDYFVGSNIEPFNSWAKILINTDHINISSDSTSFYFQFPWLNESDADAVVNCGTSLVVNGSADVSAAPGIFSGDKAYLTMRASLSLLRWSGWGSDPTGHTLDQTYDPSVAESQTITNLACGRRPKSLAMQTISRPHSNSLKVSCATT